jgi:hypothetical protein
MTRYTTRSRLWVEDHTFDNEHPLEPELQVSGPKHVDIGIVDAHGVAIYRVQPPVGFGRDGEW